MSDMSHRSVRQTSGGTCGRCEGGVDASGRHVGWYLLVLNLKVEMSKEPVSKKRLVGIAS